ncbi:MAG: hypothetical protein A2729_05760 [Candidatus Buchananbacteria bacterium RIFCSPHIGHO2_01_FULL_39_14]|nr:MAG: hypothetical protein A2729_05760 [Candidatus Buchananbacteria bacterium RIFCSPHIGHO2_01_FULL_39_14]
MKGMPTLIKIKIIIPALILFLFLPLKPIQAADLSVAKKYAGRFLLQTESYGRAWYVEPKTFERYYFKDAKTALEVTELLGLGITNVDLEKIPTEKGQKFDRRLVNRLKGRLLIAVEKNGEAWYVNPVDNLRYYLKDETIFDLIKKFHIAVKNKELSQVPMNQKQIVCDYTFADVAYVRYDGKNFTKSYNSEVILPLASLTKLMTALVLLDLNPDWQKKITITAAQLNYPKNYVADDATSEVDFQLGDTLSFYDLWVAMLVSSANQATAALVDSSGIDRADFVEKMNQKAKDLGLKKTIFYDLAGLDAHNVTTTKEMAKLALAAFAKPEISETTTIRDYNLSALDKTGTAKSIKTTNRNFSLFQYEPQAVKTGYLVEAQRTMVLKKNNAIIVVMHALSMKQRNQTIEYLLKQ